MIETWMEKGRNRVISAQSLRDGTWILQVARENAQTAAEMTSRPVLPTRSLTWGSCCSGSEGARFCFEALGILAAEMGAGISFRHIFSCENNEEKIQWVQMVNDLAPAAVASMNARLGGQNSLPPAAPARPPVEEDARPCVFTDICKLGQSSAPCAAHARKPDSTASEAAAASSSAARVSDRAKSLVSDRGIHHCPVPQVDILLIGTSCKDMSRANPNKARHNQVLLNDTSDGGSAQTFKGMLAYIDSHSPSIVVFENVDTIDDAVLHSLSFILCSC